MTSHITPSDPQKWPVGTSSSLFHQLSPTDLDACAEAGVSHIELFIRASDLNTPEGIDHLLQHAHNIHSAGLTLWSVHLPFGPAWDFAGPDTVLREQVIEKLGEIVEAAGSWGIARAVIHPSYEPVPHEQRSLYIHHCKEALHRLAMTASQHGVTLAVECLPRTCLGNNSSEILELLADSEHLRVCFDANHMFMETPQEFVERMGNRIVTVHISDYDGVNERHWMPGRGITDWNAVIDGLARIGYHGPFLFELSQKNAEHPLVPQDLTDCWQRLLAHYLA